MNKKCEKCGICTKVCPIIELTNGPEIFKIFMGEDIEIWNCCSCFLCEENCPNNLSVREEIFKKRRSLDIDNFPHRIRKYLENIKETGFIFPMDEFHNVLREKLGLKELNLEKIKTEIKELFKRSKHEGST
ncbi:MAG: 4Fe-4S dicluster domain-containing protein [Candidatus Helarchaeota archaeon]